jgi:PAS domain S-box-containing protein
MDFHSLNDFVSGIPEGILITNADGVILLCNALLATMFGYSAAELVGKSHLLLVPECFRETHKTYFQAFLGGSHDARLMGFGREVVGLRRDGREFPVELGLNRLTTSTGTLVMAVVVELDKRPKDRGSSELSAQVEICEDLGIPAAGFKTPDELVCSNASFAEVRRYFFAEKQFNFISLAAQKWLEASVNGGAATCRARFSVQGLEGTAATAEIRASRASRQMFLLRLTPTVFPIGKNVKLLREAFGLTEAEARVAARSATGRKVPQIALELGISKNTVRSHLAHIFEKTGVCSHAQLVARVSALKGRPE